MRWNIIKKDFKVNKVVYLIAAPVMLYFIIFCYLPMFGVVMAFERFSPKLGFFGSPWVGLQYFRDFFKSFYFVRLIRNTIGMSLYDIIVGFPAPIIFALLLNEVRNKTFKKITQTVSYMPYFISVVVVAGLIIDFTGSSGFITQIVSLFTGDNSNLLARPELFKSIYVLSNVWQMMGFGSIIYLAAITGIDQELYQAADMDGAGRWRQVLHITIPSIIPTIVILLILRLGNIMSIGFDKVFLLYSPVTYETADVISTFVYRKGLLESNFGYSTAIGLFNSVVNFGLLILTNALSKKATESSLF